MHEYKVGEYFYGSPKRLPSHTRLDYDNTGLHLVVCLDRMTEEEIEKLKTGRAEFALYLKDGILFFLVRIPGVLDWSDAPLHLGLYTTPPALPEIPEGLGLSLTIYGIEATDGVLKAMRLVGLGTKFSRRIVDTLKLQQRQGPVVRQEIEMSIARIQREYTSADMLRYAAMRYETNR